MQMHMEYADVDLGRSISRPKTLIATANELNWVEKRTHSVAI